MLFYQELFLWYQSIGNVPKIKKKSKWEMIIYTLCLLCYRISEDTGFRKQIEALTVEVPFLWNDIQSNQM